MTERFLPSNPPSDAELSSLRAWVKQELQRKTELFTQLHGRRLIGVAGTATYLAAADLGLKKFDVEQVQGHALTKKSIVALTERLRTMTSQERLGVGGMDKGRADVIVAGAIILDEVLEAAKADTIYISTRGLRYGVVMSGD
jgi:exopolyphosphatase/guanosine-5'-triphosphate,3'-diphosphate pyrophosphatase